MDTQVEKKIGSFSDIGTTEKLITYLESSSRRDNVKFLHHYTTLDVVVKAIRNKSWHICSAENMNDLLEFNSGDLLRWRNILFSSFMGESDESIAMWSMYGQPWRRGVKISIPTKLVHNWLKNTKCLNEISVKDYSPTGNTIKIEKGALKMIAVSYSNFQDVESENAQVLSWSNQNNRKYRINSGNIGELTGYVKNKAWDYEKEHRMMLAQDDVFERGSIDIPDDVIEGLILTHSPLFEGNFLDELSKAVELEVNVKESLFFNKLNIRTNCERCAFGYKLKTT